MTSRIRQDLRFEFGRPERRCFTTAQSQARLHLAISPEPESKAQVAARDSSVFRRMAMNRLEYTNIFAQTVFFLHFAMILQSLERVSQSSDEFTYLIPATYVLHLQLHLLPAVSFSIPAEHHAVQFLGSSLDALLTLEQVIFLGASNWFPSNCSYMHIIMHTYNMY
jgi:hypothetical protein